MSTAQGTYNEDNLLAGDFPLKTKPVTVLSGETVVRGQVMGKVTSGGKFRGCNVGLSDGAEVAEAVLAEDVDASLADAPGIVYLTGSFNTRQMSVATSPTGSDTVTAHEAELRLRSIFINGSVSVLGTIN